LYEPYLTKLAAGKLKILSGLPGLRGIMLIWLLGFIYGSHAQETNDTVNLGEVVVTGTIKEMRKEEFAIPVEIYPSDYFQAANVTNVLDAIRYISGVQGNIDGAVDGASDIEINGMEGTYTLVLLDGAPIAGGTGNLYGLIGIPMAIIERIEVIKGPASTLYGTEAVAGVVNIITRSLSKMPKVAIDARLTSYLENSIDVTARLKEGKASGLIGISLFNMNKKWDLNNDNFTDVPIQNRIAFFNKWSFRDKFQRQSGIMARYLWENRAGGELQYKKNDRGSGDVYGEMIRTNRLELMGNYMLPFEKVNANVQFMYTNHKGDAAYGANKYKHTEQTGYIQFIYDNKIARKSDFLIGISYRFNWYDDNLYTTLDTAKGVKLNRPIVNHYPAIFFQDMIQFNKNNEVLVGFRMEYNTQFNGVAFAPRFDYKWLSTNKLTALRFGIGTGYRTPNAFIDDKYAFTSGRKIELDMDLKTESAYGFHADYWRRWVLGNANVTFESRLFYTLIRNMVEAEIDFDNNVVRYENEGNLGMNFGLNTMLEATFSVPVKMSFGLNALGNILYEKDEATGEAEIERTPNSPLINATYSVSYSFKKSGITLDLNGYLNSPMRMNVQENDPRSEYSPWYSVMNIQCTKHFRHNVDLSFGLNNILNVRPPQPILRPFDPFNKDADNTTTNPNGLRFDTGYNYAPNQGIKGFVGVRWSM
jgi:outer membrane receptor for ferrienterochelin and colicins